MMDDTKKTNKQKKTLKVQGRCDAMRQDVACSVGIKWAGAFWPLMDRSIDDDDENGQDSTRVMNSLV